MSIQGCLIPGLRCIPVQKVLVPETSPVHIFHTEFSTVPWVVPHRTIGIHLTQALFPFGPNGGSLMGREADLYMLNAAWSDQSFSCLMQFQWIIHMSSMTRPNSLKCKSLEDWFSSNKPYSISCLSIVSLEKVSGTSSFATKKLHFPSYSTQKYLSDSFPFGKMHRNYCVYRR